MRVPQKGRAGSLQATRPEIADLPALTDAHTSAPYEYNNHVRGSSHDRFATPACRLRLPAPAGEWLWRGRQLAKKRGAVHKRA